MKPPGERLLMKIPALNVVQLCGTLVGEPQAVTYPQLTVSFHIQVSTYSAGRKTRIVIVFIRCMDDLARAVLERLHAGDVILLTGSMRADTTDSVIYVFASAIQFLT